MKNYVITINCVEKHKGITICRAGYAVWAIIGGFSVIDRWHPAVVAVTLEGNGKTIGDCRVLTLVDGTPIKEKLLLYEEEKNNTAIRHSRIAAAGKRLCVFYNC